MEWEREIRSIEKLLNNTLPKSYRELLLEKQSLEKQGFLGLQNDYETVSLLECTQVLRSQRPDLPRTLIAVAVRDNNVLCLDSAQTVYNDCPLVETTLNQNAPLIPVHNSFKQFFENQTVNRERYLLAIQTLKNRKDELEKQDAKWAEKAKRPPRRLTHTGKGIDGNPILPLHPRAEDWSPRIVRMHDYVIGLTAYRYNSDEGCLEVDEFYASDHPHYQEGHAVRGIVSLILSAAYRRSASLDIIFTRQSVEAPDLGEIRTDLSHNKRVSRFVPEELVELAKQYGIAFPLRTAGRVLHKEAVSLYRALLNLPSDVTEIIDSLEKDECITTESICYVIHAGIWTKDEAIWLLRNAPRPEAILLGTDTPEFRLHYSESLLYGRTAMLVTKFRQAIMAQLSMGTPQEDIEGIECSLLSQNTIWRLKANKELALPWLTDSSAKITISPDQEMNLLCKPLLPSKKDELTRSLWSDAVELVKFGAKENVLCLLISYEPRWEWENEVLDIARICATNGIHIIASPFRSGLLDEEVEQRMSRARRIKHFPARRSQPTIHVFEIDAEQWQRPGGLRNASRDAKTFADWIVRKIDIQRARGRFTMNSECVERIALQDQTSRNCCKFEGKESQELLTALTEDNIMFSYVGPDDLPAFLHRLPLSLRPKFAGISGGLVFIVPAFSRSIIPPAMDSKPTDTVSANLQSEMKPVFNIDQYVYKNRRKITRTHKQIQNAFRRNQPFCASYVDARLLVDILRDYVFQREMSTLGHKELRISYNDGTEGKPFPIQCLQPGGAIPGGLFELPVAAISMRHMEIDRHVTICLATNREIHRYETSAEQEEHMFSKTVAFIETLLLAVQGQSGIKQLPLNLRTLLMELNAHETKHDGCLLHLYQGTGLEPATMGTYRAIVECLRRFRGKLVVVPRLFVRDDYQRAEAWF